MPKSLRRRIFYTLIAIFLVLGSGAVLYAQGWRLVPGPAGIGLDKVGGIYLRTFPETASVALNGKLYERRPGLFDKGTLFSDLLPGTYRLEASAPGFHSWSQQANVSSSLVTALRSVVLVPTQATTTTSTPVQAIFPAGDTLVMRTSSGLATLSGAAIAGSEIRASSESGSVLLTYATTTRRWFAVDLGRATTTALGQLAGTPSFQIVPGDETLFLMRHTTGLNLMHLPNGGLTPLATSTVSAAAAVSGRVFWTRFDPRTHISLLSFYDISARSLALDADSLPGRVTAIVPRDGNNLFALADDGSLYSLSLGQSSRTRLAQNARSMALTESGDALAVLDAQGLQVFFPRNGRPNLSFEIPDAARAQRLAWYRDNEHLFVIYPDRVAFLDLTDAGLKNFTTAAESGQVEYQPESNILYFLDKNVLYALSFPSS
jgi:hypothetical protein